MKEFIVGLYAILVFYSVGFSLLCTVFMFENYSTLNDLIDKHFPPKRRKK